MDRVLWPMEPVEPRIANFFTDSIFADLRLLARQAGFERCKAFANVYGQVKHFGEVLDRAALILTA
jgi:hypothetical protein